MTAFNRTRTIEHSTHNPLFPVCGKRRDHFGHWWTPHSISRHEAGCRKCQRLLDTGQARRQSEYRARLNPHPDDYFLEEFPLADQEILGEQA